jgi:hypothetical protein
MTPVLTPARSLTTRRALLRLLDRRPNEVIGLADVCDELGRAVVRESVHKAATTLARDLPIESVRGPGGGYVLLRPMPTLGAERCANCEHRTADGWCPRTRRAVDLNCHCWGWEWTL